jgi:uncharacterized cupredoxin-like copper-binding protein
MKVFVVVLVVTLAGILAACGGPGSETRTIAVRMFDDMRYDPAEFDFFAGDTVRFEVTNSGRVRHEFFIGDLTEHAVHAAEMREEGHSDEAHDNPAAVRVEPGETGALEYTFPDAGQLLAGCHEPGHYEAGMVAPIIVHP